jgi:chromosomal replication initiation ATPase DnaA
LTPAAGDTPNGLIPDLVSGPPELIAAWCAALVSLQKQLSTPTYHAHIASLRPIELTGDDIAVFLVPSAFTREWLEKRHVPAIAAALSEALGRSVTVRLTQIAPYAAASASEEG